MAMENPPFIDDVFHSPPPFIGDNNHHGAGQLSACRIDLDPFSRRRRGGVSVEVGSS